MHFDWAGFDLMAGLCDRAIAQMAWNVYLANPGPGGELQVFRRPGTRPGLTKAEAEARGPEVVFGNYGFPDSMVGGCQRATIGVGAGDLVIFMNRHFHRVADLVPPEAAQDRVAISAHIVGLDDGTFHDFS